MARNSTERFGGKYDLESRGSVFPAHLSRSPHRFPRHLQMWYYAGFEGGGTFCEITHLTYCPSTTLLDI